jgi:hypothetical protein
MKKYVVFILVQLVWGTAIIAGETNNPLNELVEDYQRASPTNHPPVSVTAYLKHVGDKSLLAFKLTNLSEKPLTLRPSELPWGNRYSTTLAAVTTDGERIPNICMIADSFEVQQITIAPGTSREGDYDIEESVQLSLAPKNKDVILLWSYKVPGSFKNSQPICTGIIVIPKR